MGVPLVSLDELRDFGTLLIQDLTQSAGLHQIEPSGTL
jgi:hypothetical protein